LPPRRGTGKDRRQDHHKDDTGRMERRSDVGHHDPEHGMLTITGAARTDAGNRVGEPAE